MVQFQKEHSAHIRNQNIDNENVRLGTKPLASKRLIMTLSNQCIQANSLLARNDFLSKTSFS